VAVPKWTVMIFMGADGVEGNVSLVKEADADIAELKQVKKSPNLEIFVERHGGGKAERLDIAGNATTLTAVQPSAAPDAFANGTALTAFIDSCTGHFDPSEQRYTMLVLWGHAYQFAFGHTATSSGLDALDFAELAGVLSGFQEQKLQQMKLAGAISTTLPKLDVVAFDACSIANIETACQLAPFARFLIASQVGVPLPGWPYRAILDRLAVPAGDRIMGPAELGCYAVRRYCEYYRALDRPVTLSHLNLSHSPDLLRGTESLARALAVAMDDSPDEIQDVAQLFRLAQTAPGEPFVDVLNLCAHLVRDSSSDTVRAAALALGDRLLSPTGEGPGTSATGDFEPFIVEHGRNSCECAGLHGVSLYAPSVAPSHDFGAASFFYEKFLFARNTVWRDLVRALALPN
jgi:Clostripain family